MEKTFLILSVFAIIVMIYAFFRVIMLNSKIPGGTVGSTWKFLTVMIGVFTAGYFTTPFFSVLPEEYKQLIVGFIFLAGAIFVVIVINLFYKVIKEMGL
jgi:hypothetical protein